MRPFVQRNNPVARTERCEIPSPPIHECKNRMSLRSIRAMKPMASAIMPRATLDIDRSRRAIGTMML